MMLFRFSRKFLLPLLVLGLTALQLSGCTAILLTGAAVGGVMVAQERSAKDAVDDTAIHGKITAGMLQKDEALFRRVDVDVVEGRVLLTGSVPKIEHRIDAARIAWQVEEVTEVLNEIQVEDKSGLEDYAKDAWITTQLRAKTLADLEITDINYTFDTVNGVVYILGIAQNREELDRVTTHARNIPGVAKVVSHALIKDDPKRKTS